MNDLLMTGNKSHKERVAIATRVFLEYKKNRVKSRAAENLGLSPQVFGDFFKKVGTFSRSENPFREAWEIVFPGEPIEMHFGKNSHTQEKKESDAKRMAMKLFSNKSFEEQVLVAEQLFRDYENGLSFTDLAEKNSVALSTIGRHFHLGGKTGDVSNANVVAWKNVYGDKNYFDVVKSPSPQKNELKRTKFSFFDDKDWDQERELCEEIFSKYKDGVSQVELASQYEMSPSTMNRLFIETAKRDNSPQKEAWKNVYRDEGYSSDFLINTVDVEEVVAPILDQKENRDGKAEVDLIVENEIDTTAELSESEKIIQSIPNLIASLTTYALEIEKNKTLSILDESIKIIREVEVQKTLLIRKNEELEKTVIEATKDKKNGAWIGRLAKLWSKK